MKAYVFLAVVGTALVFLSFNEASAGGGVAVGVGWSSGSVHVDGYYGGHRSHRGGRLFKRRPIVRQYGHWGRRYDYGRGWPGHGVTFGCGVGLGYYERIRPVIVEVRERPVIVLQQPEVPPSVKQLLIESLRRDAFQERLAAAQALAGFPDTPAVAALADALFNDGSSRVRAAAARSLGEIARPIAYDALWRSKRTDRDEQVRAAAQEAVERIEATVAERLPLRGRVLWQTRDGRRLHERIEDLRRGRVEIRKRAAKKLRDFRDTRATVALIDALMNDDDGDVRKTAAKSLGKIADRMALPFLRAARENDRSEAVRKAARKVVKSSRQKVW